MNSAIKEKINLARANGESEDWIANTLIPQLKKRYKDESDVSGVTAMVVDNGFFVDMARTLGRAYKKVYYCVPSWVTPSPTLTTSEIGYGFKEIEIVAGVFSIPVEDIDVYVFLDCGHYDLQLHLEALGKRVWGGKNGEKLEFNRVDTKDILKKAGMPVGKYEVIKGTPDLRKFLKENDNQIVKMDIYRGVMETFKSTNYGISEFLIDDIDMKLGAFKNTQKFIVEETLKDKVEVGYDGWCIDGKFPDSALFGIEVKNLGYIGQYGTYDSLPQPVKDINNTLVPELTDTRYRATLSLEIRIGKDKKPYLIDITSRLPEPPESIYQCFYKNLPEIIYAGANGEIVEPIAKGKWACEIILQTDWMKGWLPVTIDKEFAPYLFLKNSVLIDDKLYVMPQADELPQCGQVVGFGDTMEDAIEMAVEAGKSVNGIYIHAPESVTTTAAKEVEKAKELGVWLK